MVEQVGHPANPITFAPTGFRAADLDDQYRLVAAGNSQLIDVNPRLHGQAAGASSRTGFCAGSV
jgi:hypothetical protein